MDTASSNRKEFLRNFPKKVAEELGALRSETGERGNSVACIDIAACLAWSDTACQICYLSCPKRDEAIQIWHEKPVIVASACDGCGKCVPACEAVNSSVAMKLVKFLSPIG